MKSDNSGFNRRDFIGGSISAAMSSIVSPALENHGHTEAAQVEKGTQQQLVETYFRIAKPIWPRGREKEMNLFVGFSAAFRAQAGQHCTLSIAASTLYRAFLNGKFLAWGPARGPHGYYRVDVHDLSERLAPGENVIAIEVAGYNVNSYYILNQPSFLQAEVRADGVVLASTGGVAKQFQARILTEKIEKAQRYTFQRSFSELYHLQSNSDLWRSKGIVSSRAECAVLEKKMLLPRRVPYPDYEKRQPQSLATNGKFRLVNKGPKSLAEDKSVPFGAKISATLLGYPESELPEIPYLELQKAEAFDSARVDEFYDSAQSLRLQAGEFKILDFGTNLCGFIGAELEVSRLTKFYFVFDETLTDGDIDFTRLMCVNLVSYTLEPGTYNLESFEPYVLRFLKLMVKEGDCAVRGVYLREYATPDVWSGSFDSNDVELNNLFRAGRETYRQNSVVLFTDTPSRERAGWLCDSSFTAQVTPLLSGHTLVEKCFFENYQLPKKFEYLPDGMIPGCYPADHYNGMTLPNWSLWFVIQLEQYVVRSNDREMAERLKSRILKLLAYFKPFENEQGLLEKLQGWVFIEWSKSNDFVQDVSFPTNMLYAAALTAVGRMYGAPERLEQAENIKRTIRTMAYDGEFFVDNAIRKDGKLTATKNRTETCQYYAFFFGTASTEAYPKLWETLRAKFGPARYRSHAFPDIAPSNAFMGNVMRLELLSRAGLTDQLVEEAKNYYLQMVDLTGTFWENMGNEASMDHAFGSHIIVHLYRDVLGVGGVDLVDKSVNLRFTPSQVQWCSGRIPTPDGFVSLRWTKGEKGIEYECDIPAGYSLKVESLGSVQAKPKRFPKGKIEFGYKIEGGYK